MPVAPATMLRLHYCDHNTETSHGCTQWNAKAKVCLRGAKGCFLTHDAIRQWAHDLKLELPQEVAK